MPQIEAYHQMSSPFLFKLCDALLLGPWKPTISSYQVAISLSRTFWHNSHNFDFCVQHNTQTLGPDNFTNNAPFVTKMVPFESPDSGLSIGTALVPNGFVWRKLFRPKVKKSTDFQTQNLKKLNYNKIINWPISIVDTIKLSMDHYQAFLKRCIFCENGLIIARHRV